MSESPFWGWDLFLVDMSVWTRQLLTSVTVTHLEPQERHPKFSSLPIFTPFSETFFPKHMQFCASWKCSRECRRYVYFICLLALNINLPSCKNYPTSIIDNTSACLIPKTQIQCYKHLTCRIWAIFTNFVFKIFNKQNIRYMVEDSWLKSCKVKSKQGRELFFALGSRLSALLGMGVLKPSWHASSGNPGMLKCVGVPQARE